MSKYNKLIINKIPLCKLKKQKLSNKSATGVDLPQGSPIGLSQNGPNPLEGTTIVSLQVSAAGSEKNLWSFMADRSKASHYLKLFARSVFDFRYVDAVGSGLSVRCLRDE